MNLEVQRKRLQAILDERPQAEAHFEETSIPDALDRARDLAERDNALLVLDKQHMKKVLARVALSKISDRTYAVCSGCDGEIGEKRLESIPEAILCIRCQEWQEQPELRGFSNFDLSASENLVPHYA